MCTPGQIHIGAHAYTCTQGTTTYTSHPQISCTGKFGWNSTQHSNKRSYYLPSSLSPASIITDLFSLHLALWLAWALVAMQWSFCYLLLERWGVTHTNEVLFAPPLWIWFFLLTRQEEFCLGHWDIYYFASLGGKFDLNSPVMVLQGMFWDEFCRGPVTTGSDVPGKRHVD